MDPAATQFADDRERFGTYRPRPLAALLGGGKVAFVPAVVLVYG
mgnify:FL=1|jgi:hypothetical protein